MLDDLYNQRILAFAADPPHSERLTDAAGSARKDSRLCGSRVTSDVVLDPAGRIARYGQEVKACVLGQAAAAILAQNVIGRSQDELNTLRDQLIAMLKADGPPPSAPFHDYEVLRPAREYRARHPSILLAVEATLAAMAAAKA